MVGLSVIVPVFPFVSSEVETRSCRVSRIRAARSARYERTRSLSPPKLRLALLQESHRAFHRIPAVARLPLADCLLMQRSEERRVGEECVSPCRSRWSP